jgi:hypothetical protein
MIRVGILPVYPCPAQPSDDIIDIETQIQAYRQHDRAFGPPRHQVVRSPRICSLALRTISSAFADWAKTPPIWSLGPQKMMRSLSVTAQENIFISKPHNNLQPKHPIAPIRFSFPGAIV